MISLTHDLIDVEAVRRSVASDDRGGVCLFAGVVRNHSDGLPTLYLEYSAHEVMALEEMRRIAQDASTRWQAKVAMVHRLGRLEIGDVAVVCAAATAHRAEAFECARYLIDTLKQGVPIWKKEARPDGAVWIEGDHVVPAE